MTNSADKDILTLLHSADRQREGFILLMERYREPLYWHIRRLVVSHEDAEDVLQESFINIHRYIDKFRGDSSLKTWLYRVATNEAIRHNKRKRSFIFSYDDAAHLVELFEGEEGVDFDSLEAKLQRAILELPTKQRVTFTLRYFEDMSYEEISEVTGQSVGTLKTNYHYAAAKIKEQVRSEE